jgi:hypothetical protein
LKEDEDRPKYQGNAAEYGTDGVRGSLRVGNQIEECKAHDQEDNKPLDPRHVGLLILPTPQPIRTPGRMYRQKPRCSPSSDACQVETQGDNEQYARALLEKAEAMVTGPSFDAEES